MTTVPQRLRWIWVLLLGLTWIAMARATATSGYGDGNHSFLAAKSGSVLWRIRFQVRGSIGLTNTLHVVFISIMKSANIADLRNNFRLIASWISDGESVEIKKRGHHFATLIPSAKAIARPMPKIDFDGRLKKIWGNRVFSDQEVAEMRLAELEGEEG
jgi:antitoxin (DNA-binding transcriptional repressor) of toxin-antitoxin stability system